MLENALTGRNCSRRFKIAVKSFVSVWIVALAVLLPQLVHLALGAQGGVRWLPMYLPVLLGGCLMGASWGLCIGVASPIAGFLITMAFGDPMPALERLPFMAAELAVFAVVSGLFTKKIAENGWMAFPAVLLASVAGRTVFMLLVLIFDWVSPLSPTVVWAQIQAGFLGLIFQAVAVPFAVMGLGKLLIRDKND